MIVGDVMATESNANAIADFDIDEVIDWDKHDIPTKDIEFDQLQGLNVQVSNVASSTTQASSTNTLNSGSRDGLVLGSQMLAATHREPGAAIVSMPQVLQSAINPVFPGDPNSLIRDIRQEYLHAQNLTTRSRTPPTPTFPSENFDLPPITPPGSMQPHSTFSVGQQRMRMALISNLNRPATVQSQLSPFVSPNLPPAMSQQLPSVVSNPLVEDSNIEELIDEIVERDMPEGVSEPIVFAPHVSQQPNPSHLQIASNALQKGISPTSVRAASPGQLAAAPTSATCKTQMSMGGVVGGSALTTAGSPGSPLASSRSPSPKVKQTNHVGKLSAPVRSVNQGMRITQPVLQPGSPLPNTTSQSGVKITRSFPSTTSQVLSSNSQMLQMAVPSAVAASAKSQTVSCQLQTPSNLQVKHSMEAAIVNPQGPKVTLPATSAQSSTSQIPGQNTVTASNKVQSQNVLQGTNISALTLQSSGKPIQTIPLHTLASNPEIWGQLVKAMGQQPNAKQQGSATNIQTGQPLICYVVPQNSASEVQSSQTKSSLPLSSSAHPVKMILVNANSPVKSSVSVKPQQAKSATSNSATAGLNCMAVESSSQLSEAKTELETAVSPSFRQLPISTVTGNLCVSGVKSDIIVPGNIATPSAHLNAAANNHQIPTSVPTQQPSRSFLANNPNSKQISTALESSQSNSVPLLQTPLSSSGNVVQITFVNEATAISQVVAASPAATLTASSSGGSQSMVAASPSVTMMPSSLPSSHMLVGPTTETSTSADQQDSDEDDDDSKPLSQVAENLKKVGGADEVKKKKKKKKDKDKGTKRKKKEKDSQVANKPLTAYELFFKDTQAAVRTKNPLAQFEDIKKIVDQMWETLTENHRKAYQEKAQQLEYQNQAKKLAQQDEPSLKLKKVEIADTATTASSSIAAPGTVEVISDTVAVASRKPFSRAPTQIAMAGKPVATVPPMAATKTTSNTNTQPTISAKPKKSKVTVNPISQRICLCEGCNKPARTTKERGTQYCSNECIVKHCRLAFTLWVTQTNEISETNG